jgi:hypothetical protein
MPLRDRAAVGAPCWVDLFTSDPDRSQAFYAELFGGAPSWFELHTRDYDATVRFYRDVFRWDAHTMSDTPEFRYTTYGKDENALVGIMDGSGYLPEGVPASWSVYFGVDDADKALAQIADLGGSVLEPAQDTPYGRLARAADPTGAAFKIGAGV